MTIKVLDVQCWSGGGGMVWVAEGWETAAVMVVVVKVVLVIMQFIDLMAVECRTQVMGRSFEYTTQSEQFLVLFVCFCSLPATQRLSDMLHKPKRVGLHM